MKNIESLNSLLDQCFLETHKVLVENICTTILKESNTNNVDEIISFLNEETASGKKGIEYRFSKAFNDLTYKGIPILALFFKEFYVLDNEGRYKELRNNIPNQTYYDDINYLILSYDGDHTAVKTIKYYLLYINILWLLRTKGGNIYFLIQTNEHKEFYSLLFLHLFNYFSTTLAKSYYQGFSPRVICGASIYTEILMYKFKNFNGFIDKIQVYRILHKLYNNFRTASEEELREILEKELYSDKHISNKYINENVIEKYLQIIKQPYNSNIIFSELTYDMGDSIENREVKIPEKTIRNILEVFNQELTPNFYVIYDIICNKLGIPVFLDNKKFESTFSDFQEIIPHFTNGGVIGYREKLLLNNISFIAQEKYLSTKKDKYSGVYEVLNEKFN